MKFILGLLALVFLGLVVVLPRYLAPDDLVDCTTQQLADEVTKCKKADAIVAVSGGDTTARTQEAIRLYKQGWAPLIIFSGAAQDISGPSNALAMKRLALAEEVPADRILIEEFSRNTEENAMNTSQFIKQRQLSRIILVTSAYHQRRASLEFGSRLGDEVKIINHPVRQDKHWGPYWWLSLDGWWLAVSEFIKIIAFYTTKSQGVNW